MKKLLLNFYSIALAVFFSTTLFAQTAGTLTFSFTPVAKSPDYEPGTSKNYLAVWIQDNTGKFIKTKYATNKNVKESDHIPTWAKISSNGTNTNCTSTLCNIFDATTGATQTTFAKKTIVWDGKNVSGAANGTTVADGVITVKIEETWNHGTTGTAVKTYTFTKGANPDHQMPADDANFTGVMLDWVPLSGVGVNEINTENIRIAVSPNPSNGIFNVDFSSASNIKIINMLGVVIHEEKVDNAGAGTRSIDLSSFTNGIYFVNVQSGDASSNLKAILNK
jgi:hypothetical protein